MSKKNFTITTVATAPSPATSGTSLVVATGTGSLFALNEPAIIFPTNNQPLVSNAEIVMVTNISSDTLTITRTQEGTSAREIVAGDMIIQGITAKDWNDLMTLVNGKITAFADPNADRIVFWDDSAEAFAALTASTGLTISGTNMTVRTASATQTGIVELATTAETQTGTDATRAVTPDGLHDMTSLAGAGWIKDEDNMASNDDTKVPTQQSVKAYVDSTKFTWKGEWATSTVYAVNDTVEYNGSGYVCVTAHTSGTFATDLSAGKWNLLVEGLPTPNLTTSTTTNLTGVITGNGSVLASKANPSGAFVGTTDTQTLTSKTLTSPVINTGVSGTAILDEDNMASNSATKLATQQSIKAYADTKIAKATNVTSIDDTGIADGEVAIFDLTNKKIKTSDKTLPTGAIVGTTDTQTLTNKTLTSPKINENVALSATATQLNNIVVAGVISMYGGSTAPSGYLLCDGSAVSRTTYADLYTAIGTTYGVGDGSTTFNVPNLKGKVAVGKDGNDTSFDTLGETGGAKTHTLTTAQLPSHTHSIMTNKDALGLGSSHIARASNSGTNDAHTPYGNATGGGEAHNNLQPYIVLNYIIKT